MNIVNVSVMKDSFLAVWCSSVVAQKALVRLWVVSETYSIRLQNIHA